MDDTLTLVKNDGTTELTFTKRVVDASGATHWDAEGAQGDLEGRLSLKRASKKTKAGIVGRNLKLVFPYYNSTSGKYEGTAQGSFVLNGPSVMPLAIQRDVVAMVLSYYDTVLNPTARENFVMGD